MTIAEILRAVVDLYDEADDAAARVVAEGFMLAALARAWEEASCDE